MPFQHLKSIGPLSKMDQRKTKFKHLSNEFEGAGVGVRGDNESCHDGFVSGR